ncbi:MAG TPA: aldehyde dehydrogenase [Nitrososphaerales archaeon]|nr:aldehyde dehydrogenase [Nitrososphaerales archaeon]
MMESASEAKISSEVKSQEYGMYIDGEWVRPRAGQSLDVVNPATEEVIAAVPKATREDVKRALEAAELAQGKWEDLSPLQRSKYLLKIAELIRRDRERLARILTAEQGKPLYESRSEIDGAATNFEYYAEFARRIEGDVLPSDYPKQSIMILKLPIGVVASITPWNFPSSTVARKLAPALITGNTIVTKPSSNTPLSTIELVKLAEQAGFPKGVLNVVTGSGSEVGEELITNKITGLVTMTGSTGAGRKIMQSASGHVAKVLLELGGKAPLIVWNDADMEWALKCAIWARFWNCGQTCICAERMYLDEKIKDRFLNSFVNVAKSLRLGDPTNPNTDLGPMVSKKEREASKNFVQTARDEGDKILLGGKEPKNMERGWYFEPTVIDVADQKSPLIQEEIFGPVVPVMGVDSFDKAIEYANDSQYGLSSYIFTKDSNRVMKAMYKIKFGESYINQVGPEQFQGAHTGFRQTGIGAEGSKYGLECYTQLKTCYVDWNEKPSLPYLFPYADKMKAGS